MDKKIRNAEQDWIPYICVVGDKEIQSGLLTVRTRENKKQEKISIVELTKTVQDKTKNMPKANLSLSMLISKRPTFI